MVQRGTRSHRGQSGEERQNSKLREGKGGKKMTREDERGTRKKIGKI